MAINERLVHTASAAGGGTGNQEERLILHLDANDVDSYDGDGTEWVDIANHEYTPATNVSEHFNTVTFSAGTSGTEVINDVGFQPDFVWLKARNQAWHHRVFDSLRGVGQPLYTNTDDAQGVNTDITLASFDTEGFTFNNFNTASNQVAWCFKAGGAPSGSDKVSIDGTSYATMSAAGLTDGTIAVDKLSVNSDLGFSVIKLDNKVTHPDKTIAHGLGVSPEMIIWKRTDSTGHWYVYHKDIGTAKHVILNSNAEAVSTPDWVEATPNSTTFDVSWSSGGRDYMAYCFASKRGVSKVGSYIGNGTTDNKIVTGFEPAFVMIKNTSITNTRWIIMDNARDPNNPAYKVLSPNYAGAEDTNTSYWLLDWEADGFRLKYGADSEFNQNGGNFIYYAVAKNTNETSLTPTKDDFTAGSVETTNLELDLDANSYSGSGNWLDGTSNSNNGTITGATYVNDGASDYFEFGSGKHVATTYDLPTSGGVSIELWFNANSGTRSYLAGNDNGSSDFRNQISVGDSTGAHTDESMTYYQSFGLSTSSGHLTFYVREGHDKYQDGEWHHLVIVGTDSGHEVYIDGESKTLTYGSGGAQANQNILWTNFCLGKLNFSSGGYMNGKIGQCRIYETALTPAQIKSNYEATGIYNTPDLKLNLDAASFDGSTNTPSTWTDSSSNSNNGTISGATFDSELGNWLNFDGSNDYVQLPLNLHNTAFSVEFWAKGTLDSNNAYIIANNSGSSQAGWHIGGANGGGTKYNFRINNGSSNYLLLDSGTVDDTVWHHVVVTWGNTASANGAKIYINGSLSSQGTSTSTTSFSFTNSDTKLMREPLGNAYSDGSIGQVRMYDVALTQAQIRQNFNFTKPNYPNGNDGTLVGLTSSDWNPDGYFTFNGTSDYLTTSIKLDTSNAFSFAVWFRPNAADNSDYQILIGNNSGSNPFGGVAIAILGSIDAIAPVNGGTSTGYGTYTNGIWNHAVYTHDGQGNLKLYLNDSEVSSFNTSLPLYTANQTIKIGDTDIGTWNHFTGDISDVKVYDRELSSEEVTAQFAIKQFDIG